MMRLRVKVLLVCLAITVGLVLLSQQYQLPSHHLTKIRKMLADTGAFWAAATESTTTIVNDSDRPSQHSKALALLQQHWQQLHPNTVPETSAEGDGGTGAETNRLESAGNRRIINATELSVGDEKETRILQETLQLQRDIEASATPRNFVEILKSITLPKKKKEKKKISYPKVVPINEQSSNMNSPALLRERAKKFASNSSVVEFMKEQKRRFLHVRRQCALVRQRAVPAGLPAGYEDPMIALTAYTHLLLDRVNQLTFCPVYKAASSSWSTNLLQLRGFWKNKGKHRTLQSVIKQVFPQLSTLTGPMLTRGTIRFMVVRHPFERLVSCYRDKYEDGAKVYYYKLYGEKMVKYFRPKPPGSTVEERKDMLQEVRTRVSKEQRLRLRGNPYANPVGPTFSEFVQFIIATPKDDEHWRPYVTHCASCFINYDVVLKFEKLHEESVQFIEYLNRSSEIQLAWENPSSLGVSTSAVACSYFSQVTPAMVKGLLKKYADDFLLYEYNGDGFLKCASNISTSAVETAPEREGSPNGSKLPAVR